MAQAHGTVPLEAPVMAGIGFSQRRQGLGLSNVEGVPQAITDAASSSGG